MRVIAGDAKGKTLKLVPGKGTRPITDKVKGALFNILSRRVPDARFLDMFAGTGGVGIEALSRGAAEVVFCETAAKAVRVIHENLAHTDLSEWAHVLHTDAFAYIAGCEEVFDIIYVAPPQYRRMWSDALLALDERPLLAPDGIVVVQIFPKEFEPLTLNHLTLTDQRTYGSTMLCFYEPTGETSPPP
jgi:16S rRNA (guanine966-N2)-methyltransferase